ncbi:hypothetical protein BDP27DRAFT_1366261 [Rhodocollybia butyracea]|uniref:Uncharacterized protein n=1 Tax=Rhodocollybia butyracea TaxID=206335 RepID=A0A9P5U478_9AGAR|nr:hypothetical protein BDP27DRAFT_1366261 [Rhodocollybia butyracea]
MFKSIALFALLNAALVSSVALVPKSITAEVPDIVNSPDAINVILTCTQTNLTTCRQFTSTVLPTAGCGILSSTGQANVQSVSTAPGIQCTLFTSDSEGTKLWASPEVDQIEKHISIHDNVQRLRRFEPRRRWQVLQAYDIQPPAPKSPLKLISCGYTFTSPPGYFLFHFLGLAIEHAILLCPSYSSNIHSHAFFVWPLYSARTPQDDEAFGEAEKYGEEMVNSQRHNAGKAVSVDDEPHGNSSNEHEQEQEDMPRTKTQLR